jgi:hypothetical protein
VKKQATAAFAVAAGLAVAVWALSVPITGKSEPWDAEWPYYFLALAATGALAGVIVPRPWWAHYAGAMAGQAGYELAFLKLGPLFVLGLVFLAGCSVIFVVAAAFAASFRKKPISNLTSPSE